MLNARGSLGAFLHSLVVILCFSCSGFRADTDTLTAGLVLNDSDTLVSAGKIHTLGFFSPANTTRRYVGIWYYVSKQTVVWVANKDMPLYDYSGTVSISEDGNIIVMNGKKEIIWSTKALGSLGNTTAQLLDTGNLILRDRSGSLIWESHRYPSNSLLPLMKLKHNVITGERTYLRSWKSPDDPADGNFTSGLYAAGGIPQIFIWNGDQPLWRSGPWNGIVWSGIAGMYSHSAYADGYSVQNDENGTFYVTAASRLKYFVRTWLDSNGVYIVQVWDEEKKDWNLRQMLPKNDHDFYNKCGPFGISYMNDVPICSCLEGYEPKNKEEWSKRIWKGGCVKRAPKLQCDRDSKATDKGKADVFVKLTMVKVPDFIVWFAGEENECRNQCLKNCSCIAYAHDPGIGCMFWNGSLIDTQMFPGTAGSDFYVRVAYSDIGHERDSKVIIVILVIAGLIAIFSCLTLSWWRITKRNVARKGRYSLSMVGVAGASDSSNIEELPVFSFEFLANATDKFSDCNKLGQGGFGPVYKGKMPNGNEIAVKRLSAASGQGLEEFMNEVFVISKLQHRNLVRLLGCCVEKGEKMLIYEYMINKSLDVFLFDPSQSVLDWRKRFNIIEGIGRGLLYLHRDSRLRIVHRDLKPSNILLDEFWDPKISDFGMARIFGGNQDQAKTQRVMGTYGYMAPEYALRGRFSEKSDVFSFGVLVLEIITGKRNTNFYNSDLSLGLLGYAWKLWNEDNVLDLVDSRISNPSFNAEIMRCLHIGLLCVQEFPINRPSISTVLSMLSSEIFDLPVPSQPAFTDKLNHFEANCSSPGKLFGFSNKLSVTVLDGR